MRHGSGRFDNLAHGYSMSSSPCDYHMARNKMEGLEPPRLPNYFEEALILITTFIITYRELGHEVLGRSLSYIGPSAVVAGGLKVNY